MGIEDIPEMRLKLSKNPENGQFELGYSSLFIQISYQHKESSRHFIYAESNTHSHEKLLDYFRAKLERFYDIDSEETEKFEITGKGWLNVSNDWKTIHFFDKSNRIFEFDPGIVKSIARRYGGKFKKRLNLKFDNSST